MKDTFLPSIISGYMVSKHGFEFSLEKTNFLENFQKNEEEEKRRELFL